MRQTDVFTGQCQGHDFEIPCIPPADGVYRCPVCGRALGIEWGVLRQEAKPPAAPDPGETGLKL